MTSTTILTTVFYFAALLVFLAAVALGKGNRDESGRTSATSAAQNLERLYPPRKFYVRLHIQKLVNGHKVGDIFCGGAAIDPSWVLTAGSCIKDAVKISVEVWDLQSTDGTSKLIPGFEAFHPEGSPKVWEFHNDIGLVKLIEPMQYDSVIPLCGQEEPRGQTMVIIGFGNRPGDVENSIIQVTAKRHLLWKFLTIFNFRADVSWVRYFEDQFCLPEVGGPLFTMEGSNHESRCVYAVASSYRFERDTECAKPYYYTIIAPLNNWIQSNMANQAWK